MVLTAADRMSIRHAIKCLTRLRDSAQREAEKYTADYNKHHRMGFQEEVDTHQASIDFLIRLLESST